MRLEEVTLLGPLRIPPMKPMILNKNKKTAIIIGLVLLILILSGLLFLFKKETSIISAKINNQEITPKDLDYQIKTDDCYGNKNQSSELALIKIINQLLEKEVLIAAFKIKITTQELEEKSAWIDANTKAPEILDCVKKVFGQDKKSYLNLYIRPTLVNPRLHSEFALALTIHQEEADRISSLKSELSQGKKLEDLSHYQKWEILKKTDLSGVRALQEAGVELAPNPLIDKVIKNLKPGEIWADIIEDDYSFQIVRFLKEDQEKYYLDGIVIPKKSFDSWFQDYVKNNVKIEIFDQEILNKIKTQYPDIWWLNYDVYRG